MEIVISKRKITICLPDVCTTRRHGTSRIKEVVVTIHIIQANHIAAANNVVSKTILCEVNTIFYISANTICTEIIPFLDSKAFFTPDILLSRHTVAVLEVITFAINFFPATSIIVRSVVVTNALKGIKPNTGNQLAILLKVISYAANFLSSSNSLVILEIVPIFTNGLPAVCQFANIAVTVDICRSI